MLTIDVFLPLRSLFIQELNDFQCFQKSRALCFRIETTLFVNKETFQRRSCRKCLRQVILQ